MTSARFRLAQLICRPLPPLIAQRWREMIYPRQMAEQDDLEFTVRAQTGSWLSGRTSDFHGYPFSVHGYYEWRLWAIALAVCPRGGTILEIGANVGTETVGYADIVGPSGAMYALEPLPKNFDALQKMAQINGFSHPHLFQYAAGAENGAFNFAVPTNPAHSGVGHLVNRENTGSNEQVISVQCVRLDSLLERFLPIQLLAMDVEGSEVFVLRGASRLIHRDHPAMILEASSKHLHRYHLAPVDLFIELTGLGYRVYAINRFGLQAITQSPAHSKSNWLCLHQNRLEVLPSIRCSMLACGLLPCLPGIHPFTRLKT